MADHPLPGEGESIPPDDRQGDPLTPESPEGPPPVEAEQHDDELIAEDPVPAVEESGGEAAGPDEPTLERSGERVADEASADDESPIDDESPANGEDARARSQPPPGTVEYVAEEDDDQLLHEAREEWATGADQDASRDDDEVELDVTEEAAPKRDPARHVWQVDQETLNKARGVFVPPEEYQSFVSRMKDSQERRLAIIHGPVGSGKTTCALRLAEDLTPGTDLAKPRVFFYNMERHSGRDLVDFVRSSRAPGKRIYIARHAFESGLRLDNVWLRELRNHLSREGAKVIVTTAMDPTGLSIPDADVLAASIQGAKQLREVFEKHLSHYGDNAVDELVGEHAKLAREAWTKLSRHLRSPSEIDSFCARLSKLPSRSLEESVIVDLATTAAFVRAADARARFEGLSLNARLFALLLHVCEGLPQRQLELVYVAVVEQLRRDGLSELSDARSLGFGDLREQVHAKPGWVERDSMTFGSVGFAHEVARQVGCYHHLLNAAMRVLSALIQGDTAPGLNGKIGQAIGRIAVHQLDALPPVIEPLARHDVAGVRAVAGSIIAALLESAADDHRHLQAVQDFVVETLTRWIGSGDPRLKWTAGACVWRYHEVCTRRVDDRRIVDAPEDGAESMCELLTTLAERLLEVDAAFLRTHVAGLARQRGPRAAGGGSAGFEIRRFLSGWFNQVAAVIRVAVIRMFLVAPAQTVEMLTAWFAARRSSPVSRLAAEATTALLSSAVSAHHSANGSSYIDSGHDRALSLLGPLLAGGADQSVRRSLSVIRRWAAVEGWQERVHEALVSAAVAADDDGRRRLIRHLARWLEDPCEAIRDLGRTVAQGAAGLLGHPVDVAGGSRVLILFDAPSAWQPESDWQAARELRLLFDRHGDATLHAVGRQAAVDTSEVEGLDKYRLAPALVMPIIESQPAGDVALVVVLSSAPIIDLDDAAECLGDRLVVASTMSAVRSGSERAERRSPAGRSVGERLSSPCTVRRLEAVVSEALSGRLAARERAEWECGIKEAFGVDVADVAECVRRLEARLFGRPAEDSAAEQGRADDVTRDVLAVISGWASVDTEAAVGFLQGLLEWRGDGEEERVSVGAAASKALFSLAGAVDGAWPGDASSLFRLVPGLVQVGDLDALRSAIQLASTWGAEEENWGAFLDSTRDGGEGLDSLRDAPVADRALLLQALRAPSQEERSGWHRAATSTLHSMLLFGRPRARPSLAGKEKYGLLLIDAAAEPEARSRQEQIASELLKLLSDSTGETLPRTIPIVHRLGQTGPELVPDEESSPDRTVMPQHEPASLLLPILDSYPRDGVHFALLLGGRRTLDHDDVEPAWRTHLVLHGGRSSELDHGMRIIKDRRDKNPSNQANYIFKRVTSSL